MVKSVRAPLTLCAQSQNGALQGTVPHARTSWAARGRRRSCLGAKAPGTGPPSLGIGRRGRRPSRCPRARDNRSRRSNVAVPGHPSLRSKRLPARTGRRKTTSPPSAARLGTPRAARSRTQQHRVCRLLAELRPTAGAVFRKAFRPASRRRGQSVLVWLREHAPCSSLNKIKVDCWRVIIFSTTCYQHLS